MNWYYVWGAYALALGAMSTEAFFLRRKRKAAAKAADRRGLRQ